MKRKLKKIEKETTEVDYEESSAGVTGKRRKQYLDGIGPERMPDEFFAPKDLYDARGNLIANAGDFNLAQVQGEKARQYFERVLRLPMPPNMVTRHIDATPESAEMRKAYGMQGEHIPVRQR